MADETPWQFIGTEETLGVFCDVFMVATDTKSNVTTLYFFQSQTRIPEGGLDATTRVEPSYKAKCIARIMVASNGLEVLLKAIADNRGLQVTAKPEEAQAT